MVTLKTLEQSTPQQVFDHVATHLLTQNKRSTNKNRDCLYKSPEGLKCAAGCIIADDEYNEKMEDVVWRMLVRREVVPEAHMELISDLQYCHDDYEPRIWKRKLKEIAKYHNLSISVLDKF